MATYPAQYIANYVVSYCTKAGHPISNLKLQKMLYFLWIEYFKKTGIELYLDDICAWKLGPVVPEVYYNFCSYAGTPIELNIPESIDDEDIGIINPVIAQYLPIAASVLVNRTHAKGKPWDMIYQDGLGNRAVIPFQLIRRLECSA